MRAPFTAAAKRRGRGAIESAEVLVFAAPEA